jgi:DNA-binding response OmpR family regulator
MASRRILLVDDSEILRVTTAALLEDAGYVVVEAGSLAQARASLASGEIAAAVVDLHLGDGLGSALLPDLRALHPRAAFILLSGTAEPMPDFDGDLYLLKGMEPEEMLARIAELIAGRD